MRRWPTTTAWLMTVLMAVATAVGFVAADDSVLLRTPVRWWMLALAFLATEARPVHLLTRRGAHTLNPIEIPLLVALGVLAGPEVILARLLGSLLNGVLIERQAPLKVIFNGAAAGLGASVAVSIASQAAGDLSSPSTWFLLLGGAIAGGLATSLPVAAVLSIFDRDRSLAECLREMAIAMLQVSGGAIVGLVVLLPIALSLWSVLVTSLLAVGFHTAFAVYGKLTRRHAELESLYAFTTVLAERVRVDDLVSGVLSGLAGALKTRTVEVTLQVDGAWEHRRWHDGVIELSRGLTDFPAPPMDQPEERLTASLRSGSNRTIGWVATWGREEQVPFIEADRRLFSAMALHAGASLGRALVEQRLRSQVAHNEELVRSKDQLIAAVSHELRTPLTGILGFAQILEEDPVDLDSSTRSDIASSIAGEALDLSFIVEDLLTAARFDLGQLAIKLEQTDVKALIDGAVSPVAGRLIPSLTVHAGPAPIVADPPRARQILRNLVVNAARYGGEQVLVRAVVAPGSVAIEVWDDGAGVDASDAERIFQPYQTAHPSTTQPGSVGLGLPISRELARMMGGDVSYDRINGWTVFRLSLRAPAGSDANPPHLWVA